VHKDLLWIASGRDRMGMDVARVKTMLSGDVEARVSCR